MILLLIYLFALGHTLIVDEFSSVILKCEINCNYTTLQWEYQFPHKDLFIAYNNLTNKTFFDNIEVTYSKNISLLKIFNVSIRDTGDYFCLTYNSSRYYSGTSWHLVVRQKPLVYIDTSNPVIEESFTETVNFIFAVSLAVFILSLLCFGFLSIYCKNEGKSYSILV